jgi:hypothetical protein
MLLPTEHEKSDCSLSRRPWIPACNMATGGLHATSVNVPIQLETKSRRVMALGAKRLRCTCSSIVHHRRMMFVRNGLASMGKQTRRLEVNMRHFVASRKLAHGGV